MHTASLCKSALRLPTERIISVFLLSILCKTSEPRSCGASDSRTRLAALNSLKVELLPVSSSDQLPTAVCPPSWAVKPPQPDSLASENVNTSGFGFWHQIGEPLLWKFSFQKRTSPTASSDKGKRLSQEAALRMSRYKLRVQSLTTGPKARLIEAKRPVNRAS